VKLCADADSLTITGTDLDTALSVRIDAVVKAPGVITLPAKKLFSYSQLLPDGDVGFKVGENSWATITAGRSRTRIAGMSADSFPELPTVPDPALTVPSGVLMTLVNRVKLAISTIESRFTLNGALFEHGDGKLRLVGTDGHRLAFATADLPSQQATRFLMPLTVIRNLSKLSAAESVAISQDDNHLFLRAGSAILTARKLTGNFPDYARVLPKESKIIVTVKRLELAGALSRVAQFADERSRAIRLSLSGAELGVSATALESGESTESVPCDYAGDTLEMGFNADYLSEFLGVIDSADVTIHLTDAKSAGEFRPAGAADYRMVVMPMRI
jgi:DNA polymerase-3 subunit beta